jgi:hypothetical protein
MEDIHCALDYHRTPNPKLANLALGVRDGQFNNPLVFITTPVSKVDFEENIKDYSGKYSAFVRGGVGQKGAFLLAKSLLMGNLDSFGVSTDGFALGDEAIILLGGFKPTKGFETAGHTPGLPEVELSRGDSTGELLSECPVVEGAEYYGALLTETKLVGTVINEAGKLIIAPGEIILQMDFNKNRKKQFLGLTASKIYFIYYYASNATGVSQLSAVKSIMCA